MMREWLSTDHMYEVEGLRTFNTFFALWRYSLWSSTVTENVWAKLQQETAHEEYATLCAMLHFFTDRDARLWAWCNMKSFFLPCLHVSCLFMVNLHQVSLPSTHLSASQCNITGFKVVKSLLEGFTGVSLASWQELPGKLLLRECGQWHGLNPCTRTRGHMHTYSFLFTTSYYDWVQDTLTQSQRGSGVILYTSNDLPSN